VTEEVPGPRVVARSIRTREAGNKTWLCPRFQGDVDHHMDSNVKTRKTSVKLFLRRMNIRIRKKKRKVEEREKDEMRFKK
jgi:hypothetical protein